MISSVNSLTKWFLTYADSFQSDDSSIQYNLDLKKHHTLRVYKEMVSLCEAEGLSPADAEIAGIIALLHDVGRFEQYSRYKTFVDRRSINHAELGLAVIRQTGILNDHPSTSQHLIETAISHHNRAAIGPLASERETLFCKLIRDADKLDILHLLTTHYHNPNRDPKSAVELTLPEKSDISPDTLSDLLAGRIVSFAHIHSNNDFKVLQMAWIFDINFDSAVRKIYTRGYFTLLRDALPDTPRAKTAYEFAQGELVKRLHPAARENRAP